MKALVVDDSSITRKIIRTVVEGLQIEVEEAEDGIDALEMLSQGYDEIGLILLDWNMPEMNGYEVLTEIKSSEKYRHIPVMMVTTEGQKSNIVAAVRMGAANYLTKPFTVEELETKIIECIGEEGDF